MDAAEDLSGVVVDPPITSDDGAGFSDEDGASTGGPDGSQEWEDMSAEEIISRLAPNVSGDAARTSKADLQDGPQDWKDMSADDIMAGLAPSKSRSVYEKEWHNFTKFLNKDVEKTEPGENDYIRYINFMRKGKKMKCTTIWSKFSCLKNCHMVSLSRSA